MQQNIHKRGVYNVLTKKEICIYKKASIKKVKLHIEYKMLSPSKQCLARLRKLKKQIFNRTKNLQFIP